MTSPDPSATPATRMPGVHPWVLGIALLVLAWTHAHHQVPWTSLPTASVAVLTAATALYATARAVLRDHHRAASVATLLLWWGFSPMFIEPVWLQALVTVVILFAVFALSRRSTAIAGPSQIIEVSALALLVVSTVGLAPALIGTTTPRVPATRAPGPPATRPHDAPDVYVVVLDAYGRADVLSESYGFDNTAFLGRLSALGFSIAERARSNYGQTGLSIPSMLSAHYLDEVLVDVDEESADRRALLSLLDPALVPETFRSVGYQVVTLRAPFSMTELRGVDRRLQPPLRVDDFHLNFLELTQLPALLRITGRPPAAIQHGLWARQVRWAFDTLPRAVPDHEPPSFVYAHIVSPHPPFVFEADGSVRSLQRPFLLDDGAVWRSHHHGNEPDYRAQYTAQLRWVNDRLLEVVAKILARERPAVILLTSDHGPGSHYDPSEPDPSPAALRERYGILLAAHGATLEQDATPINAIRAVMRATIGAALPPVPDRTLHSTYATPFSFSPVAPEALEP